MARPSEAEARWMRSVQAGDVTFHIAVMDIKRPGTYYDCTLPAKDRGVLTRMRKKGWIAHEYNKDALHSYLVKLTSEGLNVFTKIKATP